MKKEIIVSFQLNDGCHQIVDFSNVDFNKISFAKNRPDANNNNLIKLCNDWKHDLQAESYQIN